MNYGCETFKIGEPIRWGFNGCQSLWCGSRMELHWVSFAKIVVNTGGHAGSRIALICIYSTTP